MTGSISFTSASDAGRVDTTKDRHHDIDWRAIAGFRNILVHDYLGVSLNGVWRIVLDRIPLLKQRVAEMLGDPPPGSNG